MSSYEDKYCYPGTGVLKNHLNIRDPERLAEAEASIVMRAMRKGLREPFVFTPDGLRNVHRQMFEKLYPFAGEFRRVDMAKIADDGKTRVDFSLGALVERKEMPRFFRELTDDLTSQQGFARPTLPEFAHRASVYLKDLNFIHPFPEGNGRVQRVFLQELASHSGFKLDITKITPQAWIAASIESYRTPEQEPDGSFSRHPKMSALIEQYCQHDRAQETTKNRYVDRLFERARPLAEKSRYTQGMPDPSSDRLNELRKHQEQSMAKALRRENRDDQDDAAYLDRLRQQRDRFKERGDTGVADETDKDKNGDKLK